MSNITCQPAIPVVSDNQAITDRSLLLACNLATIVDLPEKKTTLDILEKRGWVLALDSHTQNIGKNTGYQGVLLIHPETKYAILAHRGMQITFPNVLAVFEIGMQKVPSIVKDALEMCELALEKIKAEGYTLFHAGFSMGGLLAQITSTHCNHLYGKNNVAICYDSPGTREAIDALKYKDNRENITIYVTSPNVVNTANTQYGFVRQIANYRYTNNDYSNSANQKNIQPISIDLGNFFNNLALCSDNLERFKKNIERTHNCATLAQDLQQQDTNTSFFRFYPIEKWPTANNTLSYDPKKDPASLSNKGPAIFQFFQCLNYSISNFTKITFLEKMGFDKKLNTLSHEIIDANISYADKDTLDSRPTLNVRSTFLEFGQKGISAINNVAPVILNALEQPQKNHPQQGMSSLATNSIFNPNTVHQNPEAKTQDTTSNQNVAHL